MSYPKEHSNDGQARSYRFRTDMDMCFMHIFSQTVDDSIIASGATSVHSNSKLEEHSLKSNDLQLASSIGNAASFSYLDNYSILK